VLAEDETIKEGISILENPLLMRDGGESLDEFNTPLVQGLSGGLMV
jgi:hypothetical protein